MARKLLLAEDSLTIQKVFDLTFRQSDISLTMVDNGADAIRLAAEISPGLVVVDLSLPDMDGFEVASALREAPATRACPVLILAGSLSPFDQEKFGRSGADGVLFKPFESQELIDRVEALLRGVEAPAAAEGRGPAAEEPWDFSDVLEEVEEEAGKGAAEPAPTAAELLPGDLGSYAKGGGAVSLDEFDVTLEEIEAPAIEEPEGPDEGAPVGAQAEDEPPEEAGEEPVLSAAQMEEVFFDDSPPAVTDLTPAIEAVEGGEAMEDLEGPGGMEFLEGAEGIEIPEEAPPQEATPPEALPPETAPEEVPPPQVAAAVGAAEEHRLAAEETVADERVLREQFSARTREILERVASEAAEKVMWEVMDRFSVEFSAKVREAVEAVAWDVIPAAAEALIREEISRIREQAREKPS
jgi:DNA-binding response OmpR family regulator